MRHIKTFNEAKVTIKNKVKSEYINKYVIVIEYMYGDADGKGFDKYAFNTPEDLSEFALFCEKCRITATEGYDIIPGYDDIVKKYHFEEHYQPEQFGDGKAPMRGIKYFYYDAAGQKSEVSIEFTPEEKSQIELQKKIRHSDYAKFKKRMRGY